MQSSKINDITLENYKEKLKGINIVEISGESCANCLSLLPVLYNIWEKRKDFNLRHVEADESIMGLLQEWKIVTAPTIIIFNDGKEIQRCKGYQPEEILELWIDAKVSEIKENK